MPSPATLADQGSKALNSQNYAQAIDFYTQALLHTPESPDYYLKRSTAYQRSSNYSLALRDAELAVVLAHKRGKRELIGNAQLRRGISLLMDGRLGDAGFCLNEAEQKAASEKDKNLIGVWKSKLEMQLAKLDEEDFNREVTVKEIPDVEIPKAATFIVGMNEKNIPLEEEKNQTSASVVPSVAEGVTTPPSKIRHEWYQTATHVVLTIYVKGVPKDKALVDIKEKSVSIAFPFVTGKEFTFDLDPLYNSVHPEKSTYKILPTKIEVKLTKQKPGQKWSDLEAPDLPDALEAVSSSPSPFFEKAKRDHPVYPTSSKSGPKDWDKLAKELTGRPKARLHEESKDKQEDKGNDNLEYDSDYEGGDPVNYFFKKLYKDADEDTRRAMMKSYVESNGTALSTNWKEVGKAPVETSPPDGMIAQKWAE